MMFDIQIKSYPEIELCTRRFTGKSRPLNCRITWDIELETQKRKKSMEKVKAVPDWLNSSMWASSRPATARSKSSNSLEGKKKNASKDMEDPLLQNTVSRSSSGGVISNHADRSSGIVIVHKHHHLHGDVKEGVTDHRKDENDNLGKTQRDPHGKTTESQCPVEDPLDADASSSSNVEPKKPSWVEARNKEFQEELSKQMIDLDALRKLSSQGIPDVGGLRATVWKLLCGYLPRNHDLWEIELRKKRLEYAAFKEELLVNPSEITRKMEGDNGEAVRVGEETERGFLQRSELSHGDHPLSMGNTSIWNKFFQDTEIVEQIERDVKRTHPDMHFFSGDSASAIENQESLQRVLLIFAKLNPGIRYVQGMNEVVAPLFYVFKTDPNDLNAAYAEADAFFCFVQLLSDFRDHFCQQLDNSIVGIRSTISNLTVLLRKHDEELWRHLEITTQVNPQFYAFRWITLLLTQEFDFPECLRIWDSLLSNQDGPLEILLRVCCAMLMSVRSQLLGGDFTMNLKLLQHYPDIDINRLLYLAEQLRTKSTN